MIRSFAVFESGGGDIPPRVDPQTAQQQVLLALLLPSGGRCLGAKLESHFSHGCRHIMIFFQLKYGALRGLCRRLGRLPAPQTE